MRALGTGFSTPCFVFMVCTAFGLYGGVALGKPPGTAGIALGVAALSASSMRQQSEKSGQGPADSQVKRNAAPDKQPSPNNQPQDSRSFSYQGISVEMSIEPAHDISQARQKSLLEGEDIKVRFTIKDQATQTPVRGVHPAAWLYEANRNPSSDGDSCKREVESFLSGSVLDAQPIDLNTFFVLALNHDATVTVVDPRFGYGGTRLLALLTLKSRGEDWLLTPNQSRLFISMPDSNEVAVADTGSWKVIKNIEAGKRPVRLALQPDEHYLWVTNESAGSSAISGVSVFSTSDLSEAAQIDTGNGSHEIVFSPDSKYAFVTNRASGTVSVIDVGTLTKIKDIYVGRAPASIAFGPAAGLAYVTSELDGAITALSPAGCRIVGRIQADPGVTKIRFTPEGRYGILVNPSKGKLYVLDSSTNRIVQTAAIGGEPDQISFSSNLVYIRQRKNSSVLMISLAKVGEVGKPISVADFPGGQHTFAEYSGLSPALTIVKTPAATSVLVANPLDKAIYYYEEGMAAPMGSFSNYGREPRAVLVVDRSLRELEPGVYTTFTKLRGPGEYKMAFLLDSPQIIHCFKENVAKDPDLEAKTEPRVNVQFIPNATPLRAGSSATLRFKLHNSSNGQVVSGLKDVLVLCFEPPGTWQQRQFALPQEDGGYAFSFVPPRTGVYYVYVSSKSKSLPINNSQFLTIEAK